MKQSALATTFLSLIVSTGSQASWQIGVAYENFSEDIDAFEISIDTLALSAGYHYPVNDNWAIVPEVKLGTGLGEDTPINENSTTPLVGGVETIRLRTDIEIDHFLELAVRLEYGFDSGVYLYAVPSYINLETTAEAEFDFQLTFDDGFVDGFSDRARESDDEWEFGVGLGLGYQFNDNIAIEFAYQEFDDTEVVSAGLKYAF